MYDLNSGFSLLTYLPVLHYTHCVLYIICLVGRKMSLFSSSFNFKLDKNIGINRQDSRGLLVGKVSCAFKANNVIV